MAAEVASIVMVGLVTAILQTLDGSEMVAEFARAGLEGPKARGAKANETVARKIPGLEIFDFDFEMAVIGFTLAPAAGILWISIDDSA
ncbi:MAG: hypothetical protein F2854_02250 [Actinobacteria bacterium]|nr:hypothetical protein [Actinomycetota bacterium]